MTGIIPQPQRLEAASVLATSFAMGAHAQTGTGPTGRMAYSTSSSANTAGRRAVQTDNYPSLRQNASLLRRGLALAAAAGALLFGAVNAYAQGPEIPNRPWYPYYEVSQAGANYTAAHVGGSWTRSSTSIQTVIDAIRSNVAGTGTTASCTIVFGTTNAPTVNVGGEAITFENVSGTGGNWGNKLWLHGTLTGNRAVANSGIIVARGNVNIWCSADITNTGSGNNATVLLQLDRHVHAL